MKTIRLCIIAEIWYLLTLLGCSQGDNFEELTPNYADTSYDVMNLCVTDTLSGIFHGNDVVEYTAFKQSEKLRPVFRIPSIIITNKGTTIVSCENRSLFDDKGEIDILVSRKECDDSIWFIKNVIKQSTDSYGRSMNPVFLVDRTGSQGRKGRVFLFACHLSGEGLAHETTTSQADIVYKYSDDDGKSWSPEYSLKHLWDLSEYTAAIPSAANGIQMKDGTFLLPLMIVKDNNWRSGIAYKKPGYEWVFSKPTQYDGDNECTVYIDNDEKVILDCRTLNNVRHRYSYDLSTNTYSLLADQPAVKVNLKAEIHKMEGIEKNLYMVTYVETPTNLRENITLYSSNDAITWTKVYCVKKGVIIGAYSNITSHKGKVFVSYEKGDEIKVQDISDLIYKEIHSK